MYEINREDLKQAFIKLLDHKLLILFITGVAFFAGILYWANQDLEVRYDATATLSVAYGENFGLLTGATVMTNYAEIVTSYRVSEHAARLLGGEGLTGEQIREMVRVTETGTSFVLRIRARADSMRTAILVANAVAESFVTQVSQITGSTTISVLDYSKTAVAVYSDRNNLLVILPPAAAFAATCIGLVVIRLFSGKVWSIKQCVVDDRELLTVIPKVRAARSVKRVEVENNKPFWKRKSSNNDNQTEV